MNDILGRLFFAGFIRLHILHHAAEAPICGVDIVAELGRHGYRLSPGTVYPVLHELEKAGYLTVRPAIIGGKVRKYCHATAAGRRALKQARRKLHELADEVLHVTADRHVTGKPRRSTRSKS